MFHSYSTIIFVLHIVGLKGATALQKNLIKAAIVVVIVSLVVAMAPLINAAFKGKYKDFPVALQIMQLVKTRYIHSNSFIKLMDLYIKTGDIRKTLASLKDPYTRYLSPKEYQDLKTQTEGTFGGIGIYLDYTNNVLTVMRPMKGTPADRAGMLQGDKILAVNGRSTKNLTLEQVVSTIKGKVGTAVTITIERGAEEHAVRKTFRIIRANIKLPTVDFQMKEDPVAGKVAYIALSQFSETTPGDLENALNSAERQGAKGIILDLRYNPGGLLTSAVSVASKFLPGNGRVLRVVQRGYPAQDYPALANQHPRLPLVVLVNEWSASASEIVAGALKDRKAGILVGNKTFGKGVVQDVIPLTNGGALTLTVAAYQTAGGHYIHRKGIEPNVRIVPPAEVTKAMKKGNFKPLQEFDKTLQDAAMKVLRQEILGVRDKKSA
jgi:carboxyl-terminal processing protease